MRYVQNALLVCKETTLEGDVVLFMELILDLST